MADMIYVDGMLVTWGERLFWGTVKPRKGTSTPAFRFPSSSAAGSSPRPSPKAIRDKLRATLRRVPEVNVKISGAGRDIRQIKNHLDYISRNGEKVLEDQDGNELADREAIRDLRDTWRDGRHGITTDNGTVRESFNIILSMPPGTRREGVHHAVRDFAAGEFGGRYDYVFVSHDDTRHPHAHLLVKAVGYDGKRLNPRKADLQRWRETFAAKLREHGIEANATKKPTRGITKHPKQRGVIAAERARRPLPSYRDRENNPNNPYTDKARETHSRVILNYRKLAEALQVSPDPADRKLAVDIVHFVKEMPVLRGLEAYQRKTRETPRDKQPTPSEDRERSITGPNKNRSDQDMDR